MNDMNDEPQKSIIADRYDFSYQAARIAKHIGEKDSNHVCVGVSGSWGSGKTSLMLMIKEILEKGPTPSLYGVEFSGRIEKIIKEIYGQDAKSSDFFSKNIKIIWFDRWFFGSEETIIKAFLFRIAKELFPIDKQLSFLFLSLAVVLSTEINLPENLPVVGNAFKLVNAGLKLVNILVPELIFQKNNMDFSDIKEKIIERLDKIPIKSKQDDEDDANRTVENVDKIIILIDDLDRLQVDEALTMLKLIRLLTEFPKINVVVSFDEQTLAKMIDNKLNGYGREYISKMINTPTYIPVLPTTKHNKKVVSVLFDGLLYNNKPLIEIIHQEYWSEISSDNYNNYSVYNDISSENISIREMRIKEDIEKLKVIRVLTDTIQTSNRDIKRINNTFRINYNSNLNPIHLLAHILEYYFFFDEYMRIIKNSSDYFIYEKRLMKNINLYKPFLNSNVHDYTAYSCKFSEKESNFFHMSYMNDKGKSLYQTNNSLYNILSTVTPDIETLRRIENGDPYPFGFCKSISLFINEGLYYNFKPSFD